MNIVLEYHAPKHQIDSKLKRTEDAVREHKKKQIKKHFVYLKLPFRNIPHIPSKNAKLSGKYKEKTHKKKQHTGKIHTHSKKKWHAWVQNMPKNYKKKKEKNTPLQDLQDTLKKKWAWVLYLPKILEMITKISEIWPCQYHNDDKKHT